MPKTIQKVVQIEVTVRLEGDAQHYSNEEINDLIKITSADKSIIKIASHVATEAQPA